MNINKVINWFLTPTSHSMGGNLAVLVLRLGFGGTLMLNHGLSKLANFSTMAEKFADPLGVGATTSLALAVFAEFFCATAVALGLFTRFAIIPLIINMSVAFIVIHANDPFAKKELAMVYDVAFIAIIMLGSGRFSLDNLLFRKSKHIS